ncbi:MAG: hypothetical protein HY717_03700 [Planctomycetes bacterium]|nr:hypothetical protein [Planctomycetota bacterium]
MIRRLRSIASAFFAVSTIALAGAGRAAEEAVKPAGPPRRVLAFYYSWYGAPGGPAKSWIHWEEGGHDPGRRDERGFHDLGAAHQPIDGPYDSLDRETIRCHARWSAEGGIDGWICTWWGIGDRQDRALRLVLEILEEMNAPIAATAYFETTGGSAARAIECLEHLLKSYGEHPKFLKHEGKPVIFVYGRAMSELPPADWKKVVAAVRDKHPCLLIADSENGELIRLFGGGHSYNPVSLVLGGADMGAYYNRLIGLCRANGAIAAATVLPGYDDRQVRSRGFALDRQGGRVYSELWQKARAARPDWILITSFNEWHEGSEIEPSREHGLHYLAATRREAAAFKRGAGGLLVEAAAPGNRLTAPPVIELEKEALLFLQPDPFRRSWTLANLSGLPQEVKISTEEAWLVKVRSSDDPGAAAASAALLGSLGLKGRRCPVDLGPEEEIHFWSRGELERYLARGGYGGAEEMRRSLALGRRIGLVSPFLPPQGWGRRLRAAAGLEVPLAAAVDSVALHVNDDPPENWRVRMRPPPGFKLQNGRLRIAGDVPPGEYRLRFAAETEPPLETELAVEIAPPFEIRAEGGGGGLQVLARPNLDPRLLDSVKELPISLQLLQPEGEPIRDGRLILKADDHVLSGRSDWEVLGLSKNGLKPGASLRCALLWAEQEFPRRYLLSAALDLGQSPMGIGLEHAGFDGEGDGGTRAAEAAGRRCRENESMGRHHSYFYFKLKGDLLPGGDAAIEVEYFDEGAGAWGIHYDSFDESQPHGGAYKGLEPVRLEGSGAWKTKVFNLSDARFRGRENFGADFRVHATGPLRLARLRAWKGPAGD